MEYNPYSIRNSDQDQTDENIYDVIPSKLKNQIHVIVDQTFGYDGFTGDSSVEKLYKIVANKLAEIHGNRALTDSAGSSRYTVLQYLIEVNDVNEFLDIVEVCFRIITMRISFVPGYKSQNNASIDAKDAVSKLNSCFRLSNVGYQFIDNVIVRLSNDLLHNEIVVTTVNLINNPIFANVNSEYIKAHEHYKNGLNKECINECLKAFESTLKIIFVQKGWEYDSKANLSDLINIAYAHQLVPEYLQAHLGCIRALLTNGVNTIRNRVGGHGQGPLLIIAEDETTKFTLNLTGSNIIYLIEISKVTSHPI